MPSSVFFQVLEDPVARSVVGLVDHMLDGDDLQLLPLRVFGEMQGSCQKEAYGIVLSLFPFDPRPEAASVSAVNLESDG